MPAETAVTRRIDGKEQNRSSDRVICELAERQHGVVARSQLLGLGVGEDAIDGRLKAARLHLLHRGVYAVGHRITSREGWWMAAVLSGGEGAVVSHRSAAQLWGIQAPARGMIEITTPRSARSCRWLKRHCGDLPSDEVTIRNRIPVTTVSRTLFDLAAVVSSQRFERVLREAEVLRLPLRPPLADLLVRHPGRRGTRLVRNTLERLSYLQSGVTRSRLEDRFLRFLARAKLPMPQTNVLLSLGDVTYEADCLWRRQRLIVELDGHEAHGTRAAFEADRDRDRRLQVAGWTVVRITWRQLEDATAVVSDLGRLLDQPLGDPSRPTPC